MLYVSVFCFSRSSSTLVCCNWSVNISRSRVNLYSASNCSDRRTKSLVASCNGISDRYNPRLKQSTNKKKKQEENTRLVEMIDYNTHAINEITQHSTWSNLRDWERWANRGRALVHSPGHVSFHPASFIFDNWKKNKKQKKIWILTGRRFSRILLCLFVFTLRRRLASWMISVPSSWWRQVAKDGTVLSSWSLIFFSFVTRM